MHIPTYQIHNVIEGYIRHCSDKGSNNSVKSFFSQKEGFKDRKDDFLDKTASEIINRIIRLKSPEKMVANVNQKSEFIFNTVDSNGKKVKNVLLVERNSFKVSPLWKMSRV